jgi:hypothetical protein
MTQCLTLDLAESARADAEPPAQRIVAMRQRTDAEQEPQNLLFVLRELSKTLLDQRHILTLSGAGLADLVARRGRESLID